MILRFEEFNEHHQQMLKDVMTFMSDYEIIEIKRDDGDSELSLHGFNGTTFSVAMEADE